MLTKNVIWNSWLGKKSMIGSDTFKKPYGVFVYEDLTSQSQHSVGITCFFSDCYFHFTTSINSLTLQSPLLVCLHLQSARFQKIRPLTALPITYWEADTLKLACFPLTLLKPKRGGLLGGGGGLKDKHGWGFQPAQANVLCVYSADDWTVASSCQSCVM